VFAPTYVMPAIKIRQPLGNNMLLEKISISFCMFFFYYRFCGNKNVKDSKYIGMWDCMLIDLDRTKLFLKKLFNVHLFLLILFLRSLNRLIIVSTICGVAIHVTLSSLSWEDLWKAWVKLNCDVIVLKMIGWILLVEIVC
jgi:hypothetical protein